MIELAIRAATIEDSKYVFEWRNDADTRTASLNTDEVPWAQHEPWFAAVLKNPRITLYLVVTAGLPHERVAMCRFNISPTERSSEISINLNPDFRGQGLAMSVLTLAIESFIAAQLGIDEIVAMIRLQNIASLRIFGAAGFAEMEERDGVVTALWTRRG